MRRTHSHPRRGNRAPAQAGKGVEAVSAKTAKVPWQPILPVPEGAGDYPKAHVVRGRPDAWWEYRDQAGALLGVIYRFTTSDGGKEVLPCVYAEHPVTKRREWRWIAFPQPRPLYLRGALRPEVPVLLVEGEKCVDAGHSLLAAELDVVSWPGGSKATSKIDWTPLAVMFFVGLVKRGYYPGVKHDAAPVFEGGQGEGKSTALKILGGDWFADTPFRMGEKDGYLSIQGVLLYEVAELEQFNRSELTAVKAFMSSTVDRFREPYGRRMKNMPRRCAFGATTNEGEYFKDTTGNRRFWPVATGRIDLDALIRDRDQLFGEAVAMMRAGVQHYPTRDQQTRLISPEQENREIPDPWHGHIYDYLEGRNMDGTSKVGIQIDRVTVRELLTKGLHFEISKLGPAKLETMRVLRRTEH